VSGTSTSALPHWTAVQTLVFLVGVLDRHKIPHTDAEPFLLLTDGHSSRISLIGPAIAKQLVPSTERMGPAERFYIELGKAKPDLAPLLLSPADHVAALSPPHLCLAGPDAAAEAPAR